MNKRKNRLMLFELMLAVAIFAFCAAICISAFAQAKKLSDGSTGLSRAAIEAENTAEVFHAYDTAAEIAAILGGSADGDTVTVTYNNQWQKSPDGFFSLELRIIPQGLLKNGEIYVYNGEDVVFSMTAAKLSGGIS